MKFKLDENIGRRGVELLKACGHDVMTVWDQGLHGVADEELFEVCSAERRVLITLLAVLENQSVAGALWIVEPGRVRVHLRDDER